LFPGWIQLAWFAKLTLYDQVRRTVQTVIV